MTEANKLRIKADYIVKNARIYTQNEKNPNASAFAVKDGRFLWVGNDEELAFDNLELENRNFQDDKSSGFQGCPVYDMQGRFIMPGIIDSHTHIGLSAMLGGDEDNDTMPMYHCKSKEDVLEHLRAMVKAKPFSLFYSMFFGKAEVLGEDGLTKSEIDKIVKHRPAILMEEECHSAWLNSGALRHFGISEDTPDIAPGYSCYMRDAQGHLTGCITEMTMLPILKLGGNLSRSQMIQSIIKIIDFLLSHGVTTVYDAGNFIREERTYRILHNMDLNGELPIRIEATHIVTLPWKLSGAIDEFKRLKGLYETDNIKFKTIKMMLDGTQRIHTACMIRPYNDTGTTGGTLVCEAELMSFLADLNMEGIDFHVHTVGSGAVRMVLDCVRRLKRRPEGFDSMVTCAHNEVIEDQDIERFASLGVAANFTPSWNGGNLASDMPHMKALLGETRAQKTLRCKTVYDTGALVTFSSDEVELHNLDHWSPFWGMEVGCTRQDPDYGGKDAPVFPTESERLELKDLIKGYTINSAKVLRLEDRIGSVEEGKDADFVVLEENIFKMDKYRLHEVLPEAVSVKGEVLKGSLEL